jgi:hypothetical protein
VVSQKGMCSLHFAHLLSAEHVGRAGVMGTVSGKFQEM